MIKQVMIYEVKSSAAPNANELFSADKKYFYWNDKAFKKIKKDDYVFVVNVHNSEVLFTKLDKIDIPITITNDLTKFEDNGQTFQVEGKYDKFIRLEIIDSKSTTKDWDWISLGSGENTYLSDDAIDRNRIKRIAILLELFQDNEIVFEKLSQSYLGQFRIESFKESNFFKSYQTSNDFYFLKAHETLDQFKTFNLDTAKYEMVSDSFKNRATIENKKLRYHQVVESFEDEELKKFGICLGKLVTYLDTKGDYKHVWNEYNPPRSIAQAGIWMGDWVSNLIQYKKNGNTYENVSESIVNAISYIEDPINNVPIISESHKGQVIRNFLGKKYERGTFVQDLKSIFNIADIIKQLQIENERNLTFALMQLLYVPEIEVAWSDYLCGFYYEDENFDSLKLQENITRNGFSELEFSSMPIGGNDTINYLEKKLKLENEVISLVVKSDGYFDVFYVNDFYTVRESKGIYTELGNYNKSFETRSKSIKDFIDKLKLNIIGFRKIFSDDLDFEDFTFLKPVKKIKKSILYPFVSPDLESFRNDTQNDINMIASVIDSNPISSLTSKLIIEHIESYINSIGFNFKREEIANFYLSLKTKPFVILAGISGTGKTQLPRLFAEAVGMSKEQVIQVPVRPDWTDASDLIGYTALNGKFISKPLTDAILKAKEFPNKPFFFILDEMNLARVEHYFSDFLSIIETRTHDDGKIITDLIITESQIKDAQNKEIFENLHWPENLYLIGTVNMDETTHPFSRKVLDRANSIEMNTVELDWLEKQSETLNPLVDFTNDHLCGKLIGSKDLSDEDKIKTNNELNELKEINDILRIADLHFAYRVRDEIIFYATHAKNEGLLKENEALDFQFMQKILPRIHGSSIRTQKVLVGLINRFSRENLSKENPDMSTIQKNKESWIKKSNYPKSLEKLIFMLERFDEDRFTSFWV
jgi:MoxR-like ATPase